MFSIINWTMAVITLLATIIFFLNVLTDKSPHFPWHKALLTFWMALYCVRFVVCALDGSIAARLAILTTACIISALRIFVGKSRADKWGGAICLFFGLLTVLLDANML